VRAEVKRLRESGVKIIIGLGHSGFDREVEIAREIPELSLIVGGHSHSLLHSPKGKRKP
jgi:5'-nucleotidase